MVREGSLERLDRDETSTVASIVGRELELDTLRRFFAAGGKSGCCELSGQAGIGKTTLWEAGVELARNSGLLALSTRASEAEARLSFAGLSDLLDGVEPAVSDALPAPQRRALAVALRRSEPDGDSPEPLAIAVGFVGVLRLLAARGPIVVAVDDVQWLDRATADALAFAVRRVDPASTRFLLSRLFGSSSTVLQAFAPGGVEELVVGGLSFGAVSELLIQRLGLLPRRALRRVFEASQGNPLVALELARALKERGIPESGEELPLPEALSDPFAARVQTLSEPVRRAVLAAALSPDLSRTSLAMVVDPLALEDALAAGLLTVERSRLRPSHPLLGAAARRMSSARERQELHGALADVVGDEVLRARHRALAAVAPSAELAEEVAAASEAALARGAVQDAVELARLAYGLTDQASPAWNERLLALARYLFSAGEVALVAELVTGALDDLPAGPIRAEAYLLLADVTDRVADAESYVAQAIADSADAPQLRARALARSATLLAIEQVARIGEAEALALEALAIARSADAYAERRALVALAWSRALRGKPIDDLSAELRRRGDSSLFESSLDRPVGVQHAFRGELEVARRVFLRTLALADERLEARSGVVLHLQLCELELRAGNVIEAARLLDEWDHWIGTESESSTGLIRARIQAVLAATRGDSAAARRSARPALAAAAPGRGRDWDRLELMRASGIAALRQGDAALAVTSLQGVWDHTTSEGVDDPGAFPVAADLVEALVESGDFATAVAVSERLRRLAVEQQHPWALATAERCDATVQLSGTHVNGAEDRLAQAAAALGKLGCGFDQARAMLFLGRVQRRLKKRAEARRSLGEAEAAFTQLGCDGWAKLARAELARVSGRRSPDDGGLTPSERGVAELAAEGLSNKEIAARLFVSVYTVEGHLKRVYAKLGIRSRGQLASRLRGQT